MDYELKPVEAYKYEENKYNTEKAKNILRSALKDKTPIVCKAIEYINESGDLIVDFYGYKGIIKRGYISKFSSMDIKYLINKAIGVHVKKIDNEEGIFLASRLKLEEEAEKELMQIQIGDVVEGIVRKVLDDKECAFVDLKEGICAYLSLKQTTHLPNTCCSINEFIKEGEKVRGKVIFVPDRGNYWKTQNIRISLVQLEADFEDLCKDYELGSIYEGIVREDRMHDVFYIVINANIYIKFQTSGKIEPGKKIKVKLKSYNPEENCIEAEPEESEPLPQPLPKQVFNGYGSMFQKEIKAVISPFAIRQNEEKNFETERGNNVSMVSVQNKYKLGHINDTHTNILKIISILGFCTSKQILSFSYSQKIDLGIKNEDKLKNKIDTLKKSGLIEIIRFQSDEGMGIFRVISISKNGLKFLKLYLKQSKALYFENMPTFSADKIKRILSANQYALACMEKIPDFYKIHCQETIFCQKQIPIRPSTIIDFQQSLVLLESVRRTDETREKFADKIERYVTLFENINNNNIAENNPAYMKCNKKVYLIFVCEDYEHANEIESIINGTILMDIAFYTHDLQIFQNDFEFSIYRVHRDRNNPLYYSVLDLFQENRECCTDKPVTDNDISGYKFNSFPEQWLSNMLLLEKDLNLENVETEDENQNMEYLYRKDYENFLKSAQLSREKKDTETLWEPRLFFFGSGGSGKTSLIKLLAGQRFNPDEPKTDGVQVLPDLFENLPWMKSGKEKIESIRVWDFAGQECDHVLTSFLITDAALCVIVVDSRREDYPDEWLNYIQIYAPRAKVLLVLNKIDSEREIVHEEERKYYSRLDLAWYLRKYSNIVGVYHISCKYPDIPGNDLNRFKEDICAQILSMGNQFKNVWVKGIKTLRDWMRTYEYGYITMHEFKRKHKELGLQERVTSNATLKLCVQAGICIYHNTMQSHIVLRPQWLTCALTKLLKSDQFSKNKWQLTKDEIISTIEKSEEDEVYRYESGEGDELLSLMQNLDICVMQGENFIFPCFLPYSLNNKSINDIMEMSDWYELEIRYKSMLPDIFPKLQIKLWNQQWNIRSDNYKPDYEPDKSKIVFIQNGRKMLAYRKKDAIVLALEKKDYEKKRLEDDDKQALKEVRQMLREINKLHGLELDTDRREESKIQECVVLKGRSNDSFMQKVRFPYPKEYLKKMCMLGIKEQYFPEVDRWYNVADLIMEEYTEDKIIQIYQDYVVAILAVSDKDDKSEATAIIRGTGFMLPYKQEWYVLCCAHELDNEDSFFMQVRSGKQMEIELLNKIYDEEKQGDIAVFKIRKERHEGKNILPKEILSFRTVVDSNDDLYCRGYYGMDQLLEIKEMHFVETDRSNKELVIEIDEEKKVVVDGMSGTPVMNLSSRCMIGMIRESCEEEQRARIISMDIIWEFMEKSLKNNI